MRRSRWRFSVRAMIVTVAIAAVFMAGLISFSRSEGWLRRPIEVAPPPRWANTDFDLFDVVFSDLNEGWRSGEADPKKSRILVDARTYRPNIDLLEDALGDRIKDVPEEIRADLVARNSRKGGYSLARYLPSNPDILVQDMDSRPRDVPFKDYYPGVRGYVFPTLPGYAHDGRMALVCFGGSLSTGRDTLGYYLLRKVKGRWEIILKGFYSVPHGW